MNASSLVSAVQTVVIKTDVEIAHPAIVCPITATLAPSTSYISLSADFKTISVDASKIVQPADNGTHSFTLTVNSANFSGAVSQQTYNFNVVIACVVTSLTITSKVADFAYSIN